MALPLSLLGSLWHHSNNRAGGRRLVLLKNTGVLLNSLDSMYRPVEIARPDFGQRIMSVPIKQTPVVCVSESCSALVGRKDKSPVTIRWLC